jgi:hypothetical protein
MTDPKNPDLALDVEKLAQLEAALAAERERRKGERIAALIEAGRVVQLIADCRFGETAASVVAAYVAAHPGEDVLFIIRTVFDAPEPPPDRPPAPAADRIDDPWGEPEPTGPIRYPSVGWM